MTLNNQLLPNDAIFEILTSVNLDDLPAWRQVNREIYNTTNEKTFKSQHCVKTNTVSGYLTAHNLSYSFLSEYPIKCRLETLDMLKKPYMRIEAVSQCRGLICCFDQAKGKLGQYYVCKPTTGQCRAIPNPSLRFSTAATAMVASTVGSVHFKIIRFSIPTNHCVNIACEIFDSRTWTWRRLKDVTQSIYFPGNWFGQQAGAVFAYGSVHWLVTDTTHKMRIFSFDVEKETWKLVEIPPRHMDFGEVWRSKITARDGKLCYAMLKDKEKMIVWTMEKHKTKASWRKEVVKFKEAKTLKEGWLEFYMEFFYCSTFGPFDYFSKDLWEKFWKSKLGKIGVQEFYVGNAFKLESDFAHCECLDRKSLVRHK